MKHGRENVGSTIVNLGKLKEKNMKQKNPSLWKNWASVKSKQKTIQNNLRSITELCQSFDQLDSVSKENELIEYISRLSKCHLDDSNPVINYDFVEKTFREVND